MSFPLQEFGEDTALAARDGSVERAIIRVVLPGFAQRIDRLPVIAFGLQRLA
jgi:hypothetical protein